MRQVPIDDSCGVYFSLERLAVLIGNTRSQRSVWICWTLRAVIASVRVADLMPTVSALNESFLIAPLAALVRLPITRLALHSSTQN